MSPEPDEYTRDAPAVNPSLLVGLIIAVVFSIVALAISSVYSSYVASTNHSKTCARSDIVLQTLHDVLVLALTPAPGQKLTASQVKGITALEAQAFQRINEARC